MLRRPMLPFTSDAGSVDAKPLSSSRPSVNVVLILILLALSYTCLNLARELHATKADATAQIEALVLSHEMLRSSVTKMNAAHTAARPEVAPAPPLESPLSPSSSSSTSTASLLALEKEIASLKKVADKIPSMKADLQRLSRDFLSIAFPNYDSIFVHLYVAFSHNDPPDSEPQLIKIKLATSEMPYTSLFFIQQIQAGIWDGGHFHRNAVHVLQADPFQGNPVGGRRKVFQDQGLYSVSFQEYNPLFPHVQYTIGLAGRPGGPDFYINKIDNSRDHGPGGQTSYAIAQEADPCFGLVVDPESLHVIHRMSRQQKVAGDNYEMMTFFVDVSKIEVVPMYTKN